MDERIISFLEDNSNKISFTYEEMISKMGIRGEKNLKKFKRSLDRLISSALIFYNSRDNVYMLFKYSNVHKGILLYDNKKRYYVVDGNSKYFVNSENLHDASYGDFVLINYSEKKHRYEVNKILKRDNTKYVATVCYHDGSLCVYDEKFGYLKIVNGDNYDLDSLVLIQKNNDSASVLEVICHKDDINADVLKIVYKHGFSNEFSKDVYKQLDGIPDNLNDDMIDKEISLGRVDMRDVSMVTIDRDDTKDMDDGIYVEKNMDGTISLYTFIADVSFFVKDGDALSVRIKDVGTSVYPPGNAIHMLPTKLSKGICSLNPNTDRFAICFKSTFDNNGELVDFDMFKAVINSNLKMSYSNVDKVLEKNEMVAGYDKFYKQLLLMEKLYLVIQKNFYDNGFLEFDNGESDFELNSEAKIEEIYKSVHGIGARLIEFFMLITNKNASEYFGYKGVPLIYRIDDEPNFKKISETIALLQEKGFLDNGIKPYDKNDELRDDYTREEIQHVLKSLKKNNLPEVFYQMFTKTMSKARFSADNIGHYPLGLLFYAQFTSPIRRGGDWRNHTILSYYLDHGKDVEATKKRFPLSVLIKEAEVYSEREREADAVEAEVTQMLLMEYIDKNMNKLNNQELIGRVCEIGTSVRVLLSNGIKCKMDIPSNVYTVDNNDLYLGKNLVCSLGDLVSVKLDGVKYKSGEVFMTLEKNLEKERCLDGEKKEKKVKIRKYIPSR